MFDFDPRDYDSRDNERHSHTPSRGARRSSGDRERDSPTAIDRLKWRTRRAVRSVVAPLAAARAIPGARLVTFNGCGHFAYLECPSEVRTALNDFFGGAPPKR
jgi:pimeloyl-ACP methyl ester carboxylesterase